MTRDKFSNEGHLNLDWDHIIMTFRVICQED